MQQAGRLDQQGQSTEKLSIRVLGNKQLPLELPLLNNTIQLFRRPNQYSDDLAHLHRRSGSSAMLVGRICFSRTMTTSCTVKAAHSPPTHGWTLAAMSRALRLGMAPGCRVGLSNVVHGVGVIFCFGPPPLGPRRQQ